MLLALSHLSVGAEAVTIAFRPSWALAATGLVVAAMVGVLAGVAPAGTRRGPRSWGRYGLELR